ncbi:MAG: glutathione-disulfide reductase [Pseudomonadales bacterium]
MQHDYDLLVIGGGSGGVRAARMSAATGKRVALVEKQYLGGTCVNVGCIPKKLFHYAAQLPTQTHEAIGFGWSEVKPSHDWSVLTRNVAAEVQRLNGIYKNMLQNAGVELFEGVAQLFDAHHVTVGDKKISAERILLATGGYPWKPDIAGIEHAITSDDFFSLPHRPERTIVVGGGYIAVELAGILHAMGSQTTLLHRGDKVLKNFDADISHFLQQEMEKQGMAFQWNDNIVSIEKIADELQVHCSSGSVLKTDCVLFATGRKPATAQLGLEAVAIQCSRSGHVVVDEHFATSVPSIFAVGDLVGHKELTPVATAEAMWLVDYWFGSRMRERIDYSLVPSAVFSSPEVASVGITQQEAESRYGVHDVEIFRTDFRPLKHTVSGSSERMMMKLIVQRSTGRVLGVHMVGAEAGEVMQGFAVALQVGATKKQFDATIGIHPTAAEEFVTLRTPLPRASH